MSQWISLTALAFLYIALLAASAWRARLIGSARPIRLNDRRRQRSVQAEAFLSSRRIRQAALEGDLRQISSGLDRDEQRVVAAASKAASERRAAFLAGRANPDAQTPAKARLW